MDSTWGCGPSGHLPSSAAFAEQHIAKSPTDRTYRLERGARATVLACDGSNVRVHRCPRLFTTAYFANCGKCQRRRSSAVPHWATVRFCNRCPAGIHPAPAAARPIAAAQDCLPESAALNQNEFRPSMILSTRPSTTLRDCTPSLAP
jgi:hypothetical protein